MPHLDDWLLVGWGFNRLFLDFTNSHWTGGVPGIIKQFKKEIMFISLKKGVPLNLFRNWKIYGKFQDPLEQKFN